MSGFLFGGAKRPYFELFYTYVSYFILDDILTKTIIGSMAKTACIIIG